MATIVRVTPISGVHSEDPLCYILEIDDCKIMLDCGWDERFETDFLQALARVASSVDFVLLSHPDLPHLGALPYAVRRLGLDCPIISTRPVWQMGHLFMFDVFQSRKANEDFDVFSLDDIDSAFSEDRFSHLKYSQRYDLPGKGAGISVTPYVAGHMLGGTIWKIQKDTEEIVYAVDCNKSRERLLNGTVLESVCDQRPAVLITDAFNAQYTQKAKMSARVRELTECALSTLRNGGNVLMPIDTAGRVFEIMLILENRWKAEKLREQYPLVLLHYEAKNVIHYGKIATEWMRDGCKFSFESFHLAERLSTLDELTTSGSPTLVLSSFASLETGFARELFLRYAPRARARRSDFTPRGMGTDGLLTRATRCSSRSAHTRTPSAGCSWTSTCSTNRRRGYCRWSSTGECRCRARSWRRSRSSSERCGTQSSARFVRRERRGNGRRLRGPR